MTPFELADHFVEELPAVHPDAAISMGLPGRHTRITDQSPRGLAERADFMRRYLGELGAAEVPDDAERRAAAFMQDRLESMLALEEAGEGLRRLSIMESGAFEIRATFDLMPSSTDEDWADVAARLDGVPNALAGAEETLRLGMARGLVASRRQAVAVARQCATWAGETGARPWFSELAASAPESVRRGRLGTRLEVAADLATDAYRAHHRFLSGEYAAAAAEADGVGADRYRLLAREFLGAVIDPVEAYEWGWSEVHRLRREMEEVAGRIEPGQPVEAVVEHLDAGRGEVLNGEQALLDYLGALVERTVAQLDGPVVRIDPRIRHVDVRVAPPGTSSAQYYTPPSEDLSRRGTYWYPTMGRTTFPTWSEVTTCYHEAIPGHHLQLAAQKLFPERLSRLQALEFISGNGEGWALYAERLMDDLGAFERAEERLGFLRAQLLRASRVVVDIGVHLGLRIPADEPFHPGEVWTAELVEAFLVERALGEPAEMQSEALRYLGWAGQAPSYKLGERVWLEGRAAARRAQGSAFDLCEWHMDALALGPLGLHALAQELPRCGAR